MSLILQEIAMHTSDYLQLNNIVVPKDVKVLELDTNRVKIGDGSAPYNSLPYIGSVVNNNSTLIDLEFDTESAPLIEIDLPVNTVLEFDFSVHSVTGSDLVTLNNHVEGSGGILCQVGSVNALPSGWTYRNHLFGQQHSTTTDTLNVIPISTNIKAAGGHGKISRRKLSGSNAVSALKVEVQFTQIAITDGTISCSLNPDQYPAVLPNDDPVKLFVGIHQDLRGFFKLYKKS